MSDVVGKKDKNKPAKDLYILSLSVNGQVKGSFKMEGFGLPNFLTSWENFLEGYVKRLDGVTNTHEAFEDAKDNTRELSIPENTNIDAAFETSVGDNTIKAYYSPFFSIGI